jgi:hypothetical protein
VTTEKTSVTSQTGKARRAKADVGRPSIGIRELKAKASAIIEDVKGRGKRLLEKPLEDNAWDAWQSLVALLSKESVKKTPGIRWYIGRD